MSLNIGRALQEGVARTVSRVGLLLVVVWGVLGALNLLSYNSALASLTAGTPSKPATIGPALDVSPTVAGAATFVLYLVSFVVVAVALRTFVTEETERIPPEYLTRNLGWMLLNYVVGFVVFFLVVWIGFLLLFVPGVFLLVSLYFWTVYVVVEDQNFVAAFRNSWALTRGDRWSLLGLGLIVLAGASVLIGGPFALSFVLSPWVTLAVYALATAIYGVFAVATTARAYVQLAADEPADETAATA